MSRTTDFSTRPRHAAHRQMGVTLIEILVAVVVLAIGLLGLGGMQMNAMKNNLSSMQRSQAVFLSYFIFDAMRANRTAAFSGEYVLADDDGCEVPLSASTLAENDIKFWIESLRSNLGDADTTCGEIECDNGLCTVRIRWNDARGTDGSNEQTFETTTQL